MLIIFNPPFTYISNQKIETIRILVLGVKTYNMKTKIKSSVLKMAKIFVLHKNNAEKLLRNW